MKLVLAAFVMLSTSLSFAIEFQYPPADLECYTAGPGLTIFAKEPRDGNSTQMCVILGNGAALKNACQSTLDNAAENGFEVVLDTEACSVTPCISPNKVTGSCIR